MTRPGRKAAGGGRSAECGPGVSGLPEARGTAAERVGPRYLRHRAALARFLARYQRWRVARRCDEPLRRARRRGRSAAALRPDNPPGGRPPVIAPHIVSPLRRTCSDHQCPTMACGTVHRPLMFGRMSATQTVITAGRKPGQPAGERLRQNGAAIRSLREKDGWHQPEFARKVGMSQSALSNIEREKRSARPATIHRIARALRVPVAAITRERDEPDHHVAWT